VAGRPEIQSMFVVWGDTTQTFQVRHAKRLRKDGLVGKRGFVPAIYELKRVVEDVVYYNITCSMEGCGMKIVPCEEKNMFKVGFLETDNRKMTIRNWNALVQYKHDIDFVI